MKRRKLPEDYRIPDEARGNTPEAVKARLDPHRDHFRRFPFGTDWTDTERSLLEALEALAERSVPSARDLVKVVRRPPEAEPYLERMGLGDPDGLREVGMQRLVLFGLAQAGLV